MKEKNKVNKVNKEQDDENVDNRASRRFVAYTAKDVKEKLGRNILCNHYPDVMEAIYGSLELSEIKIALKNNMAEDEELNIMLKKRKAQLRMYVVRDAVRNGKVVESFKLLADSDEQRAMLNTRAEVKENTDNKKKINIIHTTRRDNQQAQPSDEER